jgi:enolase
VSSTRITRIRAWEALDSRGRPTVAARVDLAGGASGKALAPSGASTGSGEAIELRDGGSRYAGDGTLRAVANARGALAQALLGLDAGDQQAVDDALRSADGSDDLGRLGGNAVVALSLAVAIASSDALGVPLYQRLGGDVRPLLPLPMVNVISGGAHASGGIDVQDLLVVPVGASSFAEAIEWAARVRRATAEVAAEKGLAVRLVADEGGLGPEHLSTAEALDLLGQGIVRSGLRPGDDASIAIDVAATQLSLGAGSYALRNQGVTLRADEFVDLIAGWCRTYPIVSVEDPLADDDWEGWARATRRLEGGLQILGDDLLVTDPARLARAIAGGVANAVLVKPNQVGTVSQAQRVVREAHRAGYATVVSARSGDTEEEWLSDLAVGWRAGQIKVGSTMRSERTAKWNRLLEIEALDPDAEYAGRSALSGRAVEASG